jgi:hypothetical protein
VATSETIVGAFRSTAAVLLASSGTQGFDETRKSSLSHARGKAA